MDLISFLTIASIIALTSLIISCLFKRFKTNRLFHSSGDTTDGCVVVNVTTNADNFHKTSSENRSSIRPVVSDEEVSPLPDCSPNTTNESFESNEDSFSHLRVDPLRHLNKSRPRRSQIRRSTRKSKYMSESNPCLDSAVDDINDMEDSNHINDYTDAKEDDNVNVFDSDFKQKISQTLSMFSQRIEDVTQPLSQTPLTPPPPPHPSQSSCDAEEVEESLVLLENSENGLPKRNTKVMGSALFSADIIAELKNRQLESNHKSLIQ